jgi:hypothetical protein
MTVRARDLGRWLVALWLLVGYTLPYTCWQKYSAEAFIRRTLADAPPLTVLLGSAAVFGAVWSTFAREARQERWASLLWLLWLVLASGYLFDPLGRGYTGVGYVRCAWVLCLLSAGLGCARLLTPTQLMGMVVVLAVAQAGYALVYFALERNLFYTHWLARTGGTFGTPVHVYTLMLLALPMCLALMHRLRYHGVRIALGVAAPVMLGALWLAYSRSAWMAAGIVLPTAVYTLWGQRHRAIILGVVFWILLGAMHALRLGGSPQLGDTTAQARVDIWRMGWQMFAQSWLWGVGTDNVRLRYTSTWRGYAVSTWCGAPENQLLLWLCERGIWGGIFGMALVTALVRRLRQMQPVYRWGLGGALLAMGILSMFQSVFGRVEEGVETVLMSAVWASMLREEAVSNA